MMPEKSSPSWWSISFGGSQMEHMVGWLYTSFSFKMVSTVKDITALQPSPKARTLQYCTFLSRGG